MSKTIGFQLLIASFLLLCQTAGWTRTLPTQKFMDGPTILFEQKELVDFVNLYILVDKLTSPSPAEEDQFVHQLENRLAEQGAVCQVLGPLAIPQMPWNFDQHSLLIARFTASDFEKRLPRILEALFSVKLSDRILMYDQNLRFQQTSHDSTPIPQTPERLLGGTAPGDPVTLLQQMYLLFSGKFNTFKLLKGINALLKKKRKPLSGAAVNADLRYWLFVYQRFVVDVLQNQFSPRSGGCQKIWAPIDLKKNKILIHTPFQLNQDSLLLSLKQQATAFKAWYLNDYLSGLGWLDFDQDFKSLLRLYAQCYCRGHSLLALDFNVENDVLQHIIQNPENFIEFYEVQ